MPNNESEDNVVAVGNNNYADKLYQEKKRKSVTLLHSVCFFRIPYNCLLSFGTKIGSKTQRNINECNISKEFYMRGSVCDCVCERTMGNATSKMCAQTHKTGKLVRSRRFDQIHIFLVISMWSISWSAALSISLNIDILMCLSPSMCVWKQFLTFNSLVRTHTHTPFVALCDRSNFMWNASKRFGVMNEFLNFVK